MAVSILQALFLIETWRAGVRFDSTLTLGRIGHLLSPGDLRRISRSLPQESEFVQMVLRGESPRYSDEMFKAMGATRVESMDASDFEGATILHDLNNPLPPNLKGHFDAVVDSGTLEHVFNVPGAFKNAMEALKVGGHFLAGLPANNWCGHGFYQFSAEFFYRVFSEGNGFRLRRLFVAPVWIAGKWLDGPAFEVADPNDMKERVEIKGNSAMSFLVQAEKVSEQVVFAKWPQQSDYEAAWARGARSASAQSPRPTMVQYAAKAYHGIRRYSGAIRRMAERTQARTIWKHRCQENPALKWHNWLT